MTYLKSFLKEYFFHSKKSRLGVLAFFLILSLLYWVPHFFKKVQPGSFKPQPELLAAIDSLQNRNVKQNLSDESEQVRQTAFQPKETNEFLAGELFEFDPNTLRAEGWQRLGLRDKTIKTIVNYRNKGGRFYQPEDLKKIWGLPYGFYERVKNYVSIPRREFPGKEYETQPYVKREKETKIVNINEADTSELIALPGIGSKLAARILNFREKLGGFYSIDQVAETYGLADSTYKKIRPFLGLSHDVRRLKVNTATKDELKAHPYIRWNLANAIVEYRNQHGSFKSLEELKNISILDEASFQKMAPYLSLETQ